MRTLVVTMAGQSSRFKNVGVNEPKWKLLLDGKSILARSLESVGTWSQQDDCETIFVCLGQHDAMAILRATCDELGIANFRIMELDETPPGQALSAKIAVETCDADSPIAIWNVDTEISSQALASVPAKGNWLSLAELQGDHWSFASIAEGLVVETAEKVRISQWASIGLYGFANKAAYLDSLSDEKVGSAVEQYVAPLYNSLIRRGAIVMPHYVDTSAVIPLGTPQEVIDYCRLTGTSLPSQMSHSMY